jgi:deoxyribodipyrimidine photo-lyase
MAMTAAPAIVWFRRDLRLGDNPALTAAQQSGRPVVPLYVLDESSAVRPLGSASRWWLDKSLRVLAVSLLAIGSRLVLRRGPAEAVLPDLAREIGAAAVSWSRVFDAGAPARDAALHGALSAMGVAVEVLDGNYLNAPDAVRNGQGWPYRVFTPYWRKARTAIDGVSPLPAPADLRPSSRWPASDDLASWGLHPTRPDWSFGFDIWSPGEAGAARALDIFVTERLGEYAAARDRPDKPGTSTLSPHLAFGEISPRQVACALFMGRDALGAPDDQVEKALAELGWREFNAQLLHHNPAMANAPLDRRFEAFQWEQDSTGFEAWRRGRTGYPAVDGAMRQLWTTGWMHNRMRMVAASFLVKDLLIDWREGEAWFWDTLVDADPANNAANWQWVAGSGADAQPFHRIFNPLTQGERFDPEGAYVRRWVPELAGLPDRFIHTPWTAPAGVLREARVRLGEDYPQPIVDHAQARTRALERFRMIRGSKG